jgi:inositol-hexakisphosphate 5-kinase
LLSERESIFATHYLPSASNEPTPRLPAAEGAESVEDLPQDLIPTMEFALPAPPPRSPVSLRNLLLPKKFASKTHRQQISSVATTSGIEQADESRGTIRTVRRVASEGQSGKRILQFRVGDQNGPASANRVIPPTGREAHTGMAQDGDMKPESIHGNNQLGQERGSAMRDTIRQKSSKERSASRGRTHVEKSIEATLPNREPGKNVRTRKSSHLMGIFKETAPSEPKKRDIQSKTAQAGHDEGERRKLPGDAPDVSQIRSQSAASKSSASLREDISRPTTSAELETRLESGHLFDLSVYAEPSISAALSDSSHSSHSRPASPARPEHDPYFRRHDLLKQSISAKRPAIPAKLLEDIRKHHNLTPIGVRGATLSHSLPSLIKRPKPGEPVGKEETGIREADDHEDDDEEHISSAVYFPHPGPSDEDIEQFTSPDEEQKVEPFPILPSPTSPTPSSEVKRILSDIGQPEHIDISVRSKHEKSVFHGDYQPPEETDDEDIERKSLGIISEKPTESIPSTSESEISSGEELSDVSQAEEGETTPTSTPVAESHLQRKKKVLKAAAPKGAVVLEPYSHQVGGHTTMFRFSRRAVCKQLNNRENEFYERIEQRHPDMLRFLPRLVP